MDANLASMSHADFVHLRAHSAYSLSEGAIKVKKLVYYEDPTTNVFQKLKAAGRAPGLPSTILIDRNGCELGFMAAPAEWASEDALRLIRAALDKN